MPLLTPEFLDHDDLIPAARSLLAKHQDGVFIDWQNAAFYGPRQLASFIGRTAQAVHDPMYAQNVMFHFHTMTPHAVIRNLHTMGLQAGLTGHTPARPESSDDDLLAAITILDHLEWVGFAHMSRVSPRLVLDTLNALTTGHSANARRDEPGYEAIDLGLRLGMDVDWFATLAADPTIADVPALRTMMALRA